MKCRKKSGNAINLFRHRHRPGLFRRGFQNLGQTCGGVFFLYPITMAEGKNKVIVYTDWIHAFEALTDEEAGKLIKHFFKYVNDQEPVLDERILQLTWIPMRLEINKQLSSNNYADRHWNWKGGVTSENRLIRNSSEYAEWRKSVFERDNYTCVNCGSNGCVLNAHHIMRFSDFPELRFDTSNGLTLCRTCHIKEHSKKVECNV